MGLLSNLISKIFSHAPVATAPTATTPAATAPAASAPAPTSATPAVASTPGNAAPAAAPAATPAPAARPSAPAAPAQPVDVAAILDGLAAKSSEKLDWKKSIVDLMKLVGMDSSLSARKELAKELHYTGYPNDSAAMNVWLHQQVLKKLSENGGKVPAELLE
jgi:Tfp pilus assembly protein FimV